VLQTNLGPWPRPTSIAFHELNGDSYAPELVVRRWTGGVHCCTTVDVHVFRDGAPPRGFVQNFGSAGVILRRVGERLLFVSGDKRFAYRFTSFADSSWPIQAYAVVGTRLVDVTRRHPSLVRADAREKWQFYLEFVRSGRDARGVLAAWAADQCMLGKHAYVRTILPSAVRRMKSRYAAGGSQGYAYTRELWAFLVQAGYAQEA
jgi:hypothetical protein